MQPFGRRCRLLFGWADVIEIEYSYWLPKVIFVFGRHFVVSYLWLFLWWRDLWVCGSWCGILILSRQAMFSGTLFSNDQLFQGDWWIGILILRAIVSLVCCPTVLFFVCVFLCVIWTYFCSGTPIARFMGPTWAHMGPTEPRLAPCWPHEACYLGSGGWVADIFGSWSFQCTVPRFVVSVWLWWTDPFGLGDGLVLHDGRDLDHYDLCRGYYQG